MAQKTINMSELKKIKRLLDGNIPIKEIARVTGFCRNTIKKYRKLGIQDPQDTSKVNTLLLKADATSYQGVKYNQLVDHFKLNENELKRTGVTRKLLWEEYKQDIESATTPTLWEHENLRGGTTYY